MGKNVLVVDDSLFIIEEMKHLLEDTEFKIIGYAKSGEDAVEMYEKTKPDIITLDLILPGIDGFETAEIILKKWPDAKIIIVSSLAYDETINKANEIGTQGFIFKPFDKEQLLSALTEINI